MTIPYVMDTSSYIEAWERRYPAPHFPGLWLKLDSLAQAGRLLSPVPVQDELRKGSTREIPGVWEWAKHHPRIFGQPAAVFRRAAEIQELFPSLVDSGKHRSEADPFVLALAEIELAILVTEEGAGTKTAVKIPTVAKALGIQTIKIVDLIVREGWVFK